MAKIEGLKELSKQLELLGNKLGTKTLRNAVRTALVPTFKEIKALAPVGKKYHRTYRGNLVAPGFLKKKIKLRSRSNRGVVSASISASGEAFYGIFLALGAKTVPSPKDFFFRIFHKNRADIENRIVIDLRKRISKL